MKSTVRRIFFVGVSMITVGLISYLFVTNDLVILQPKGTIAEQQADLLIFATLLSLVVILPVFALTLFIALKYREGNKKSKYTPDQDGNTQLELVWWGIPIFIILILSVITWITSHSLDPYKPLASDQKPVKVQVVALQYKWLFIYPEEQIATVNYLRIPEDRPINFEITADAPMNSFWIPQLGGQIYAMAGMQTKLHLMADEPGIYDGYSANISGSGFSKMRFKVESSTNESFLSWVDESKISNAYIDKYSYEILAKAETKPESVPSTYIVTNKNMFTDIIDSYMGHHSSENNQFKESNDIHDDHSGGSH